MNRRFSAGSGDWDAKVNEIMYPHSFPEDEARAFLKSMGEETLESKLLEQIDSLGTKLKDETIEVYFFGMGIATYQNGEIAVKL